MITITQSGRRHENIKKRMENSEGIKKNPAVTIITPTYNSERTLQECLKSIKHQDYPGEVEIIIVDGGSTDNTLEIAKKYTNKIYQNPLKTGEAGKAVGVKHATGEIIALIDSDNILPERDWLARMTAPFAADPEIAGAEPLYYTYRREDGYITRYCALMGMNDPLCLFTGNYDRVNLITGRWTEMPVDEEDLGDYLKVGLNGKKLPTIGANGFLVRKELLDKCSIEDYLFDIDVVYELVMQGHNRFAKVKTGIIHIFSGSLSTFIKKQRRRIRDYGYYEKLGIRKYPWSALSKGKLLKFITYTILILPLIAQAAKGWKHEKDPAWLFHIPACWTTLTIYSWGAAKNMVKTEEEDRSKWGQR